MAISTVVTKIITAILLLVLNIVFGLLPLKLVKTATHMENERRRSIIAKVISCLSCFAGGVFLATCLLDLLPTVRDKLTLVFDHLQIYTSFPVAEFVMAIGLFLVIIVEKAVKVYKGVPAAPKHRSRRFSDRESNNKPLVANSTRRSSDPHQPLLDKDSSSISDHSILSPDADVHYQSLPLEHSHQHADFPTDSDAHSKLRSYILLLALSVHSIFEGLALGLETDNAQVLEIFSAIIIHKNVLAFSLGLSLVQSRLSSGAVLKSLLLFAVMSPLGIGVGIGLTQSVSSFTSSLVDGLLQGIATGTFLYITFLEILPHELGSEDDSLLKVLFILIGFSVVAGILFLDIDAPSGPPACRGGSQPV